MTKKEEEFWKLAQEMLAEKDFSRIKELEELNEQHKKINGELRQENIVLKETNKELSKELTKDKVLKQECITTCCGIPINEIPKLQQRIDKAIEYNEHLIRDAKYHLNLGHLKKMKKILKGE